MNEILEKQSKRGGKRPGSGRKKGTGNKSSEEARLKAASTGETPLDYMLRMMRDTTLEYAIRNDMAKAAAPYVHAKLASVEHKGDGGGPLVLEIVRFADKSA